jgi:C-terminal processing protease CtpA/Prc
LLQGYDELWVTKLVPGHPAELCKQIEIHDVLCAVDGKCVLGWDLDDVCNIIKGQEGTPVVLEFRRCVTSLTCVTCFLMLSPSYHHTNALCSLRLSTGL